MSRDKLEMSLGHFVEVARTLGPDGFLRKFTDPMMVALGALKTEEVQQRIGGTLAIQIESPATYDRATTEALSGRVFRVPAATTSSGEVIIGRDEKVQLVVDDESVSAQHCRIRWEDGEVHIGDLESTNGTLLNLRPLIPGIEVRLANEDVITAGKFCFQFYLPRNFFRILEGLATSIET